MPNYTPPPASAVDFTAVGPYYLAPVATAVDFTQYGEAYLVWGVGSLGYSGSAEVGHGVGLSGIGDLFFDGSAQGLIACVADAVGDLIFSGSAVVSNLYVEASGSLVYSGASEVTATPPNFEAAGIGRLAYTGVAYDKGWLVSGNGKVAFRGELLLNLGVSVVTTRNTCLLGGAAEVKRGVSGAGTGAMPRLSGSATMAHGVSVSCDSAIGFSGYAEGLHRQRFTLIADDYLRFSGYADVVGGNSLPPPDVEIFAAMKQRVIYVLR